MSQDTLQAEVRVTPLTLVVSPRQQLGDQIVGASDEGLALELADHVIRHLVGNIPYSGFYDSPSMGPLDCIVLVVSPQPAFVLLDFQALVGQLGYVTS